MKPSHKPVKKKKFVKHTDYENSGADKIYVEGPMTHIFCGSCGHKQSLHNNGLNTVCGKCDKYTEVQPHYTAPKQSKEWFTGTITYRYFDETNFPRVGHSKLTVYAHRSNADSILVKQFIKPDNFKNIINVKVWGPHPTVDES